MISPELLRRYEFFAGFDHRQLDDLAMAAEEASVHADHWFFEEGETLSNFFLLVEGSIALTHNVPDRNVKQTTTMQLTGNMAMEPISIGTLGEREVFGWSAIIPPHKSTAGMQALTDCRVFTFDMEKLRPSLNGNCVFGQLITMKAAQIIRERLRMRRIELLGDYLQTA